MMEISKGCTIKMVFILIIFKGSCDKNQSRRDHFSVKSCRMISKRREIFIKIFSCSKFQKFHHPFINVNTESILTMFEFKEFAFRGQRFTMGNLGGAVSSFELPDNLFDQIFC